MAGLRNSVQCGQLRRPLDPSHPQSGSIDIAYVVVPALARHKLGDPVFVLAGGPGQSAIALAPALTGLLGRLGNRRDIVFVDQRGTGRSAPLDCGEPMGESLAEPADLERQLGQLSACRARLAVLPYIRNVANLAFFTTTIAVQDLDAVRRAMGAERVDLIGASYGTRVALEFMRQFPAAVRRVVLDGVAPPDMALPDSAAADVEAAFEKLLTACNAEAACAAVYPDLRADWAGLLASLPKAVTAPDPLSGLAQTFTLTRESLYAAIRAPLYTPATAAALPAAIHAAAHGRMDGLVGLSALLRPDQASRVALGMHFSVVCAEDVPPLGKAAGGDVGFSGDSARLYARACAAWPRGAVPAAFYRVMPSAAPVLVLSGGLDPATPPRHAERVVRLLGTSAQHVVVANAGHGVMAIGCMRDVIYRFIDADDDQAASAVDAGCVKTIPRPPAFRPVEAEAAAR